MPRGIEEKTVAEWIDAFNERDLDRMLEQVDPDVLFYPLRVNGLARSRLGHDGVRRWFAELQQHEHPHRIRLDRIDGLADGRLLAAGAVSAEEGTGAPFSGLYEIADDLIVCAHHYFTRPETLVQIGIVG